MCQLAGVNWPTAQAAGKRQMHSKRYVQEMAPRLFKDFSPIEDN